MSGNRWLPGEQYGIVLRPTDLFLLGEKVQLHPILTKEDAFKLDFDIATGETSGHKGNSDQLPFSMKGEAATLPRLTEVIIITRMSPWCTIVRNPLGVSLEDVCAMLWKEYSETPLTEAEFTMLAAREQDKVKRAGLMREAGGFTAAFGGQWGSAREFPVNRCRRVDWLYGRVMFDGLEIDNEFAKKRLGYAAPNIFKLNLTQI